MFDENRGFKMYETKNGFLRETKTEDRSSVGKKQRV